MQVPDQTFQNPIPELVSDKIYELLDQHDLLKSKGVRNYRMRKQFRALRADDVPATDAIEQVQTEHPHLQFDTVRKIVYNLNS